MSTTIVAHIKMQDLQVKKLLNKFWKFFSGIKQYVKNLKHINSTKIKKIYKDSLKTIDKFVCKN